MKYQIQFTDKSVSAEKKGNDFKINDQIFDFELLNQTEDSLSLNIGNKIFKINLISKGEDGKSIKAAVNGKVAEFSFKSDLDLLLDKMGGSSIGVKSAQKIKAPMPGLVVSVLVRPGNLVEKGQILLNFEAMKMENQLKSPGNGTVKSISVQSGDKIEKGQILIELE
jgi:biotin carboxyl carrier protein